MGSIGPNVDQKAELTSQHISAIRQLLEDHKDGSRVLTPDEEGYEESIARWSAAAVKRSPATFLPMTAESISIVLPYLSKYNIDVSVKGGGHSTAGASSTATGLSINLGKLNHALVDPATQTIRVGGGANWGEVDEALSEHGLGTVGGTVSDTGVGGLTLGGGFGWLSGQYGLTVDNLISAKLVLANGKIITASKQENPNLFWGLRGAGQNLGVAAEFVLQAFPTSDVWAGMLAFPPPLLPEVVRVWNEITPKMLGKGAGGIGFARPPPAGGQLLVLSPVFYDGTEEQGKEAFKQLLDLGPIMNDAKTRAYPEVNRMLNIPPGLRVSMKGATFNLPVRPEFAQQVMDAYSKFTETVADAAGSMLLFEMFDPTVAARLATNTDMAFANRGNHLNAMVGPVWTDVNKDNICRQWARDVTALFVEELELSKKKGETEVGKDAVMLYGNYDHYDEKGRDIFGVNYPRLAELKKEYDPGNMFNKLFPVVPAT